MDSGLKNPKIVVDTNVLVAACISHIIFEIGMVIQHEFYRDSIKLFDFFRKHPNVGYLLPKVDTESKSVLGNAVWDIFNERFQSNPDLKDRLHDEVSNIILACGIEMKGLKQLLASEDLDRKLVTANLKSVKAMTAYLANKWENSDKSDKQLKRFMKNHPNWCDEQILAEAITLMQKLGGRNPEFDFMIASFDEGFFSPHMASGRAFGAVTREIQARFGYHCDRAPGILSRSGYRPANP